MLPYPFMMLHIFLYLGLFGLLTSTAYSLLVVVAAVRFARKRRTIAPARAHSPVSMLKPLHGAEPELAGYLEGFFQQDYPEYEILFCARSADDPGLAIAQRVAASHPEIPCRFFTSGEPPYANAKVASLERMSGAAQHELLVISDSDVRVTPGYLRQVTAPFADAEVGVVTCLYRGVAAPPERGDASAPSRLWSLLEGVGMSIEMSAGVLVAEMMEGMQFALGPTMVVRRACVAEMGGFDALGQYCSDDFLLGNLIAARGHRVVLSGHVIDHIILNENFSDSIQHQVRWMKSTRYSRPKGHFGTALTFSLPFGVLACAAGLMLHHPALGWAALLWTIADRMLLAGVVGAAVVQEPTLWRTLLLYPVRDLMGFCFWVASYVTNRILWRGEVYRLEAGGRMVSDATGPSSTREEGESTLQA